MDALAPGRPDEILPTPSTAEPASTPASDGVSQGEPLPALESTNDTMPAVVSCTEDIDNAAGNCDAVASEQQTLLDAIRDASPVDALNDSVASSPADTNATVEDQTYGRRWRPCRCHPKSSASTAKQVPKSGVAHSAAERDHSRDIPWPFVVIMVALAGALILAVWLHNPAAVGHVKPKTITIFVDTPNASPEIDPSHTFRSNTDKTSVPAEDLATDDARLKNGGACDHRKDDENDDHDDAWCACLCQPKGPLTTGRIVNDQCTCDCLAPSPSSTGMAATHPYMMCIVAVAQICSLVIAVVALGYILAA